MTSDLFKPVMRKDATISPCGRYRYELRRTWDKQKPALAACMLNPSTADAEKDDPTIRQLIGFATLWGYGGLYVVNLFAFRASQPKDLPGNIVEAIGPDNNLYIDEAFNMARHRGKPALAAWGNLPQPIMIPTRDKLLARARHHMVHLVCLGTTLDGAPKHPMARGRHRIPSDQQPIMFQNAMAVGDTAPAVQEAKGS